MSTILNVKPGDIIIADPSPESQTDVWAESVALPTLGDISPNWGKARMFCLKGTIVTVISVSEQSDGKFIYVGMIEGKIMPFGFGRSW